MPEAPQAFYLENPEYKPVVLQLLFNRHITEKKDIEAVLHPVFSAHTFDPFLFRDMAAAVDLIISHVRARNKIFVYGDYDADGVTSSALLVNVLRSLRADVEVYIPDRVSEGYGLNLAAVEFIAGKEAKLIITVDSGIRSFKEVARAKELGVDVIVTDHHISSENEAEIPACLVLNPVLKNETYPFKYLAGVGVSYKLAKAIISRAKIPDDLKVEMEEASLDLLAIGTVADCVVLLGENRVLVKKGLETLTTTKRVGLKELIKVAQINVSKKMNSWNIGFQIAPRINAAGRMDHANTAYELLTTKDEKRAGILAAELNERNIQRQKETENIFFQANQQVDEEKKIVVSVCRLDKEKESEIWNEGIVGLVAGRLCERYYRPALVITQTESGYKGSGRSIPEFNLVEAIAEAGEYLEKYGGHPMACGFSLSGDTLDGFIRKIGEIAAEKLAGENLQPKLKIETELDLADINEDLLEDITKLEPFGQGNDKPIFMSKRAQIVDILKMGNEGQHLKLKLRGERSDIINAIGFSQTEKWSHLNIGDFIDIAYYLDLNEFNGRVEAQMKIVDIKKNF